MLYNKKTYSYYKNVLSRPHYHTEVRVEIWDIIDKAQHKLNFVAVTFLWLGQALQKSMGQENKLFSEDIKGLC